MDKDTKKNYQLYGRNDMIMLDEHNKIYGSLGMAEPYIVATKEGETLLLNGAKDNEPFIGLSIYGKSHQNMVAGNQLIPMTVGEEIVSKDGFVSAICTEDGVNIEAIVGASAQAHSDIYFIGTGSSVNDYEEYQDFEAGMTYTAKCDSINYGLYVSVLRGGAKTTLCQVNSNTGSRTFSPQEGDIFRVFLRPNKNFTETENDVVHVMISSNMNAPIWEPYTEGQPSPNPDYPQKIESVGDDGEIGVDVYGGNFLTDVTDKVISGDVGDSVNDVRAIWNVILDKNLLDKELIFSFDSDSNIGRDFLCQIYVIVGNSNKWSGETCKQIAKGRNYFSIAKVFDELPEGNVTHVHVQLRINKVPIEELQFTVSNPMLNIGSTALPFESYKQPQSLIVSTPNGLPGIPVSSGGNYTDENGQQWISDEIDFKRGKYVQRVGHYVFDGSEDEAWSITHYNTFDFDYAYIMINRSILRYEIKWLLCNMGVGRAWSVEGCCFVNNYNKFIFYHPLISNVLSQGVDAWKSWLQDNPLELYYILETPIETDLTPEQITAYQSLHTNYPTTTVTNDSDAGMKAIYKQIENGG